MSGYSYRNAKSFHCECGVRYLWEKRGGWDLRSGDRDTKETIRDYYLTNSEPVTKCTSCGRSLVVSA